MYYKLDKKFAFRGWKGLPFAIRRMDPEGYLERPLFLDKETFLTALHCNGVEHVDEDTLSERGRGVLEEMVSHGVAAKSDEPMGPLESYQRHHVYEGLYLEAVHWSITGKCNYRCRHCLVSAPTACHPEPSFEQIVNIADQIKRCGVRKVDITGGEPLVRRDFIDVVRALTERGIHIGTMFTNTALLTGELLDQMEALGQHPSFQISYDGYGHPTGCAASPAPRRRPRPPASSCMSAATTTPSPPASTRATMTPCPTSGATSRPAAARRCA